MIPTAIQHIPHPDIIILIIMIISIIILLPIKITPLSRLYSIIRNNLSIPTLCIHLNHLLAVLWNIAIQTNSTMVLLVIVVALNLCHKLLFHVNVVLTMVINMSPLVDNLLMI